MTAFLIFLVLTAPPQSTSLRMDSAETPADASASWTGARKSGRTWLTLYLHCMILNKGSIQVHF